MTYDTKVATINYQKNVATIDYSRCDSLVLSKETFKDEHYKVNLLHTHELEYRVNLSKQDRVIGGKHLALADGGANSSIIGLDMRIFYFNDDGKRVSIRIAGDYQLMGNRLCCGCSVAKSSIEWIKLLWPQGAQVKTQQNSILSVVQMRDNECLFNDIAIQHGGLQQILTPNGVQLPLVMKNGLVYLEHYYPTAKQMR